MNIHKNRYIDAFAKLIIFSGVVHVLVLIIYSIMNLNFEKLSYFEIIEINLFFTQPLNMLFSVIIALIIYLIIYFRFTKKS